MKTYRLKSQSGRKNGLQLRSIGGSTLVISMLSVAILAMVGASVLSIVRNRLNVTVQSTKWNAALAQAEAGIQIARGALLTSTSSPSTAWAAWTKKTDPITGTEYYERSVTDTADPTRSMTVQADKRVLSGSPKVWWRVRSMGSVGLSSAITVSNDKLDVGLRRVSFGRDTAVLRLFDQPDEVLAQPQATRVIETILEPSSYFSYALFARDKIDIDHLTVDSFDSSSSEVSLQKPALTAGSKNQNGSVGTNATTGRAIDSKAQAHIYGDASTNGATMNQWENRVQWEYRTDQYQELPSVTRVNFRGIPEVLTIGKSVVVPPTATSWETAKEILWSGNMMLSGTNKLSFKNSQGGTHVIVQVDGNMAVAKSAISLEIEQGVKVKFVVDGDITLYEAGIDLKSGKAPDFRIYGMPGTTPSIPTTGKKNAADAGRQAGLHGGITVALYAPDHDVYVGKNNVLSIGAIVGRNIDIKANPHTRFSYDEALANEDPAVDYKVVWWMEDIPRL